MRKVAIIAVVAVGTSLALFAGVGNPAASNQKTQTECCDTSECCLEGGAEDCCDKGCE